MVTKVTNNAPMVTEITKSEASLIPVRHEQGELFLCDISDAVIKDDMASMEHPIFSLSKKPDTAIRTYEHNGNTLEIIPSVLGIATIYDKDLLIYAISQLMAAKNQMLPISRELIITARDLLIFTNRRTGGREYELLEKSLKRLGGTRINTNIKTGKERQFNEFGLVDSSNVVRSDKTGRIIEIRIVISKWLFNAIYANEVLTLHPDYFRLRKPLERRIYEIARKYCGNSYQKSIGLDKLYKKTGSQSPLKHFRYLLRDIIKTDHLPDYHVSINDADLVTFTTKQDSKAGQLRKTSTKYSVDNLDQLLGSRAALKARTLAQRKNRDWYQLKSEFVELLNSSDEERENIAGSFIGFIKSKPAL